MSGFWEAKKDIKKPTAHEVANAMNQKELYGEPVQEEVVLDEEALRVFQEDPNVDIFEEEEDDTSEVMHDANLRLEMGRLYQMVLQGNIFADTNADPRAIKNVQREIRKLVRGKMEIMLGIRQEQPEQAIVVSSPFNDLEVTVLKMLASKMSKGATEESTSVAPAAPAVPKKDGITSISGTLRPTPPLSSPKPLQKYAPPIQKSQPKQAPKPAPKAAKPEEESILSKPINQMTPEELSAHDKAASERALKKHAAMPSSLVPHPTPAQLEMMYASAAAQTTIANPWRVNQSQ